MKLRCSKNSIRIRVRKSEVDTLKTATALSEEVQIGTAVFSFGLQRSELSFVNATLDNGNITVHIPVKEMDEWLNSEQVGIEVEQGIEGGGTLQLLIEKDFPCVTRKDENKSDTFQQLASKNDQVC